MYLGDRFVQKENGSCSNGDQKDKNGDCHSNFLHYDEKNKIWRDEGYVQIGEDSKDADDSEQTLHTVIGGTIDPADDEITKAQEGFNANNEAEGVHFLSPKYWQANDDSYMWDMPNLRTSFYTQLSGSDTNIGGTWISGEGEFDANDEAEKVHYLSPGYWEHEANYNMPFMRTTYYDKKNSVYRQPTQLVQDADTNIGGTWISGEGEPAFDANEEAEKVHYLSPGYWEHEANYNMPFMRTTYYDKKNSVWRQPTQLVQLEEDTKDKKAKEVEEKGFADDKGVKEGDDVDAKVEKAEKPADTADTKVKAAPKEVTKVAGSGSNGSKDAPVKADEGTDAEVSKDGAAEGDNKDASADKSKQSGGNADSSKDQSDEDIKETSSAKENKAHAKKSVGEQAKDAYTPYSANAMPEKVHTLEPGVYQTRSNNL
jgi:hypothetical protein